MKLGILILTLLVLFGLCAAFSDSDNSDETKAKANATATPKPKLSDVLNSGK